MLAYSLNYPLLTVYERWDLEKPCIPERSRLYQLEPIGIGTAYVESLTGYIARLAESHCVLPGMLILSELAPLFKEGYVFEGREGGINRVFGRDTKNLNGTGAAAARLVRATEALTLRQDLRFLTLLTWGQVIPQKDLPSKVRAWCPACYKEWRDSQQPIYEPLLWSLKAVTVCPRHRRPLCQRCPHCHQVAAPLTWQSQPGFCPKCSGWLGVDQSADSEKWMEDDLKRRLWSAQNVGELLAATPDLSRPLAEERVKNIIFAYVKQVTEGNLSEFARLLGMAKSTVWPWYSGRAVPSLDTLIEICYRFGVSLSDLLIREVVVDKVQGTLVKEKQLPYQSASFNRQSFDLNKVQDGLLAAFKETPPPSLMAIAKRFGHSTTTFYSHFPGLSYALSERYTNHRKASHEELITKISQEVRACAIELHNQQIEPTARRVAEQLVKPGAIRNKEVRTALCEVRKELGWEK